MEVRLLDNQRRGMFSMVDHNDNQRRSMFSMGQHMDNIYHSHNSKSFCMCFWQGGHSNSNFFLDVSHCIDKVLDISHCIDKVLDNHKLICKLEHHSKYFCSKDICEILVLDLQFSRLRILWILLSLLIRHRLHLNW